MMRPNEDGRLELHRKNLSTMEADAILCALSDEDKAKVKTLWLFENQLDAIPESVLLLKNMNELAIGHNQIKSLPEWIGNLTSLIWVGVHTNDIETLPVSTGNLVNLQQIFLYDNCLESFPSSMLKLTNLKSLYVDKNALPEHLRTSTLTYATTQKRLREIAVEEWSIHAREATATWMLGGHQTTLHRDVRNMIVGMIYATRQEEIWEEVVEDEKIKTAKI